MRYLVLLFFAIVMLNEPITSAADLGQSAVSDQGATSDSSPAAAPASLDLVSPSFIAAVENETTQLSPIEVSPEVPRRVWYQTLDLASPTASRCCAPSATPATVIPEGIRLLCFIHGRSSLPISTSQPSTSTTAPALLTTTYRSQNGPSLLISTSQLSTSTAAPALLPTSCRSQEAVPRCPA